MGLFGIDGGSWLKAGGELFGTIFGAREAEQMNNRNMHEQERYAQNALQWRTNDAVAAGLHPIYAMGANLPSFAPVTVQADMSGLGRAADALAEGYADPKANDSRFGWSRVDLRDRALFHQMGMLKYQEQIEADKASISDEEVKQARLTTRMMERQLNKDDRVAAPPLDSDAWVRKPSEVLGQSSQYPYLTSGPEGPSFTKYRTPFGVSMIAPAGSSFGEAMESMESGTLQAFVVAANLAHFGRGWIQDAAKAFGWSDSLAGEILKRGLKYGGVPK